ncbi:Aspartic proteinase yapsin-3 [Wickerhamiella sorbophila]|uniref:Aspartic proteinase yapsin-3 n=1 Tax=Wickerhamiella sorbophila TaxID=45607 RepID=A0A2T0FI76_9ASCO|nr:Aspartic proteinase yapsin-3 [Wickerhamiella sorbophila]PRT54649.1 Aspartic proteinase yapsin-3 [Wickerhamiella sorbophila]
MYVNGALCLSILACLGPVVATSKGYIQMDLESSTGAQPALDRYQRQLARRDGSIQMDLTNLASYYQVKLSMGTPSQDVLLTVDTGSSDLWVLASDSDECQSGQCSSGSSFDENKSSTFKGNTSDPFGISYGDGTSAKGYWAQDVLGLNGQVVEGGNFALATTTSSNLPVFGIGLVAGETAKTPYDNVPVQLKNQGLIKTVAYSLWLNDIDAKQGSLLFGGVDHSKYNGQLLKVPMVNDGQITSSGPATSLSVMLHGLSVFTPDNFEAEILTTALATLLDSGTTLSYLPTSMVQAIGAASNATWSNSLSMNLLPCNVEGGLTFDFSGIKIRVPYHQMLMDIKSSDGNKVTLPDGEQACALGIQGWGKSQYILGDTLLRGCYAVFDLENKEVALAPINYSPSSPTIDAISGSIPSASEAPSYSSTATQAGFSTVQLKYSSMSDPAPGPTSSAESSGASSAVSSAQSSSESSSASSASPSPTSSNATSGSTSSMSSTMNSTSIQMSTFASNSSDLSSLASSTVSNSTVSSASSASSAVNSTVVTSAPTSTQRSSSTSPTSSSVVATTSTVSETHKKKNGASVPLLSRSVAGVANLLLFLFAF